MEGVKEVVFLSGKGGAGKTSILGGIYSLMNGKKAVVDCDVDAANLFLILGGQVKEEKPFYGSKKAEIKRDKCKECGLCKDICSFGAINEFLMVDPILCEGCGSCFVFCPHSAVSLLGEIPYDPLITEAQREGKTIVEYSRDSKSSKALQRVYERFSKILEELR